MLFGCFVYYDADNYAAVPALLGVPVTLHILAVVALYATSTMPVSDVKVVTLINLYHYGRVIDSLVARVTRTTFGLASVTPVALIAPHYTCMSKA